MRMNRTLNQLRWIVVSYVTRPETAYYLITSIILLFSAVIMFMMMSSSPQEATASSLFQVFAICLLSSAWVHFLVLAPLMDQRNREFAWITPNYNLGHLTVALTWMMFPPCALTCALAIAGASSVTWLPILTATSLLSGCFVAAKAFLSNQSQRLVGVGSGWIFGIALVFLMQSGMRLESTPFLETICAIPIGYLRGDFYFLIPFAWLVNAILAMTFCALILSQREFKGIDRSIERDAMVGDVKHASNTPYSEMLHWANSSCDRRMHRYLSRVSSQGTWNEIQRWRVAGRTGTLTWWILAFVTTFLSFGIVLIGMQQDVRMLIWSMMLFTVLFLPVNVIWEWRRRRRSLELEVLRPKRLVQFQFELAAAFLLDLIPIILLATIGLLLLAILPDSRSNANDAMRFLLICGPTGVLVLIACCSALVLIDDKGHQIGVGFLSMVSVFLAGFGYGAVASYPWHVLCLSAVIAVMSIMSLSGLYKYWEDMELGRVNREGLEGP